MIVNPEGIPLTETDSYSNFCKYIRSTEEGVKRCTQCDYLGSLKAMEKGEPVVYTCHAGLIDAAGPIVVNNVLLGCFLSGQVISIDKQLDFEEIWMRNRDLGLDQSIMEKYYHEIEKVDANKVKTAIEMITLMNRYIAETGRVNIFEKQLMQEEKNRVNLEQLLREMQFKALQAQINPHFLFNCLNTIASVAIIEGAYETQELIHALSQILRKSIRDSDKVITLKEELQFIDDYLYIQKNRFGSRISIKYDIDESLLDSLVPKFCLQPLVENAIIHGLEPKKEGGELSILVRKKDANLELRIEDTGMGIPDFVIGQVLEETDIFERKSKGLGISNVNMRIKYFFGSEYGMRITSQLKVGTIIIIQMPHVVGDLSKFNHI